MTVTYQVKRTKTSNKIGPATLYETHPEGNRESRRKAAKMSRVKAAERRASLRLRVQINNKNLARELKKRGEK